MHCFQVRDIITNAGGSTPRRPSAQEVKIKTEAMADNRLVETEDKTVRIQVKAKTQILWTAVLILLLIGLVLGIVIFGIKISRR